MTLSIYLTELWKIYNFILDEIIACDDRDRPSIDNSKRRLLQDKNKVNKPLESSNNNSPHFENFKSLQRPLGVSIEASKQGYYSRLSKKIMDPSTSPKTYWSVLKSFLDNNQIPCIPSIFHVNRIVTSFFRKQFSNIDNSGREIQPIPHPKTLSNHIYWKG